MFLLDATPVTTSSMGFGDWPAWIALAVAILSPFVTTVLTNKHQRKILSMEQEFERSKSCDKLIAELTSLASHSPLGFSGFSKEALEATRYLKKDTFQVFLELSEELFRISRTEPYSGIKSIQDIEFSILPDKCDPTTKKAARYNEIALLIINELKNAA